MQRTSHLNLIVDVNELELEGGAPKKRRTFLNRVS